MKLVEKIGKALGKRKDIIFAYLYGSFAKGISRRESDIDIGIFLEKDFKKDAFYEAKLALEIEREAKLKNVEVVVLNDKSLRFLNQVLRYGKLIISKGESERIKFETLVTRRYIEFKPYYEEYDKIRERRLGLIKV